MDTMKGFQINYMYANHHLLSVMKSWCKKFYCC